MSSIIEKNRGSLARWVETRGQPLPDGPETVPQDSTHR